MYSDSYRYKDVVIVVVEGGRRPGQSTITLVYSRFRRLYQTYCLPVNAYSFFFFNSFFEINAYFLY